LENQIEVDLNITPDLRCPENSRSNTQPEGLLSTRFTDSLGSTAGPPLYLRPNSYPAGQYYIHNATHSHARSNRKKPLNTKPNKTQKTKTQPNPLPQTTQKKTNQKTPPPNQSAQAILPAHPPLWMK